MIKQKKQSNSHRGLPFFYGWVIVFIGALGFFFSGPGQTYGISVFIDSFINDLGLTRSTISTFYSFGTLLAGMIILLVGKQIDRFGHRKMITIISIIFGAICLYMSYVVHPVMLFIGFFLLRLGGQGSMMIGPSTLIPKWFKNKRGTALSLASIGIIVSSGLFPPLNAWMINNWGWRMGWRFWAIAIWLIMVPLAWFLIRNNPKDIGLVQDGPIKGDLSKCQNKNDKSIPEKIEAASLSLNEARHIPSFWLLHSLSFVFAMITTGITFHIISVFREQGLSAEIAASTLSITAIISFPAMIIAGFILDRIKIRYVLAFSYILFSITLVWLLNVNTLPKAIIFGILQGIIFGFQELALRLVWPNYFGIGHLGSIMGVAQISMVVGSAFGPLPFGIAFDFFGGYREIILMMILISTLSAITAFFSFTPIEKRNLKT